MGELPHRQLSTGTFYGFFERASATRKNRTHISVLGVMGSNLILYFLAN